MIIDKTYQTTSTELEQEVRAEAEAHERALRAALNEPSDPIVDERFVELERLTAADIVMKMRGVERLAATADEIERRRFAEIFARMGKQFEAAALRLRRFRCDDGTPAYLREGSEVALRSAL